MSLKVIGEVNDPLKKIEGFEGYQHLFVKDESSSDLNETRTFKDRQPQALAKLLPARYPNRKITIAAMSTGNTAFSVAHFAQEYNRRNGKELARTVIFIPDTLEKRSYFGPDTEKRIVPAADYIKMIEGMATVVRLNFQEKNAFGKPKYLESLTLAKECLKRGLVDDLFIDVTEGLETAAILEKPEVQKFSDKDYVKKTKIGIRAYEPVIKEAIELMRERHGVTPDIIVSQFGAGILYNEIVQYCKDNGIVATIVPVAVGSASSAADKIYASFWVDKVEQMQFMGTAKSKHVRYPATVYGLEDWELGNVLDQFAGKLDAEISGLAGLAVLHRLQSIVGYDPRNNNVLVINTGNGIPNFLSKKREVSAAQPARSEKLITLREASDLLGVHANTLRQWESRGIIQSVRIGARQDRKFRREEIDRILGGQNGSSSKEFAFHKGKDAFNRLFKQIANTLTSREYYWTFAFDSEYASPEVREILSDLHHALQKKGIEDRVICRAGTLPAIQKTFAGNKHMKIRAVNADIPTGVIILPDRVIHLLWGDIPAAYEVLSAEAVRQYQNLFNGTWAKAEK
jgi:excisionase family DNA binding protein